MPGLAALGLNPTLAALIQVGAFAAKVACFLFLYVWVRWTLPRFRYDQLMNIGWKVLLPIALGHILWVAFIILMNWA